MRSQHVHFKIIGLVFAGVATLTACDDNGGTTDPPPINRPPSVEDETVSLHEGETHTGIIEASDPEGAFLAYSIDRPPRLGTAQVDRDTGEYRYEPHADTHGDDTFAVAVSDGEHTATATITVSINARPTAEPGCLQLHRSDYEGSDLSNAAVVEHGALHYETKLVGDDVETPDALTYELVPEPDEPNQTTTDIVAEWGTVHLEKTTGALRVAIDERSDAGEVSFRFRVVDGASLGSEPADYRLVIAPRIMPLGDSITTGVTEVDEKRTAVYPEAPRRVGYRGPLSRSLADAGFKFDLVGSETFGEKSQDYPDLDPDNEGHGGRSASELTDGSDDDPDWDYPGIKGALDANPADIILLHIGTNYLSDAQTASNDLKVLLKRIIGRDPSPTVVVAKIIDQYPDDPNEREQIQAKIKEYNRLVTELVGELRDDNGDSLILVDHYEALAEQDMSDQWHPNTTGYQKMAEVWLEPLTGVDTEAGSYEGPALLSQCR